MHENRQELLLHFLEFLLYFPHTRIDEDAIPAGDTEQNIDYYLCSNHTHRLNSINFIYRRNHNHRRLIDHAKMFTSQLMITKSH